MRFIQVGVGGFGATWVERLVRSESAEMVAAADIDGQALEAARARADLTPDRCFADFRRAFGEVEADAALVVTPPAVHAEVALTAIEAGLHVLVEKPFTDGMESARQVVAAAESAGATVMVSQNYRFRAWVRTIRALLDDGGLGAPDSVAVRFAKAPEFPGSFRLTMAHPLVAEMSIHHFDLMRALTGREPLSVYATTWRPEWSWFGHHPCAMVVFEFEGGLKVLYNGSWVTRGRETSWNADWTVECRDAVIELRDESIHLTMADHPGQDTEVELQAMPCEGQEFALREFQRAVAEGREPEASGRDNLASMAMVFAAVQSADSGLPVDIRNVLEAA